MATAIASPKMRPPNLLDASAKQFICCHSKGGMNSFLDGYGYATYSKTFYIQNNGVSSSSGEGEPLLPDVIWYAPYRLSN